MRGWILVAALMTSGIAAATDSSTFQLRNTDDLVRVCSVAPDHALYANAMGFCHGILFGAYRFYHSTVTAENRFICPPSAEPTRAQVMDGFVVWAKAHSQYLNDPPVDALFRYLEATYPCGK